MTGVKTVHKTKEVRHTLLNYSLIVTGFLTLLTSGGIWHTTKLRAQEMSPIFHSSEEAAKAFMALVIEGTHLKPGAEETRINVSDIISQDSLKKLQ